MRSSGTTHSLDSTSVLDAMARGVISCPPATPLRGVARLMVEHRIHAVYVFDYGFEDDENVTPWGLVSDLDLVAATQGDFDSRSARDAAVTPLVTIRASDSLGEAAALMSEYGVSHLAVLDPATERPVGVISTLDLAQTLMNGRPPRAAVTAAGDHDYR